MTHDEGEQRQPRVFHVNDPNCPADAVYIGRPAWGHKGSRWRNPYCDEHEYRTYVAMVLAADSDYLKPLFGKSLCCWCKGYVSPRTGKRSKDKAWCHGDVLLALIAEKEGAE